MYASFFGQSSHLHPVPSLAYRKFLDPRNSLPEDLHGERKANARFVGAKICRLTVRANFAPISTYSAFVLQGPQLGQTCVSYVPQRFPRSARTSLGLLLARGPAGLAIVNLKIQSAHQTAHRWFSFCSSVARCWQRFWNVTMTIF